LSKIVFIFYGQLIRCFSFKYFGSVVEMSNTVLNATRVRNHFSDFGVNNECLEEENKLHQRWDDIKRLGEPEKPNKPTKPEKGDKEAMEKWEKETEVWKESMAKFRKYKSPEYKEAVVVYQLVGVLRRLTVELGKTQTEARKKAVSELREKLKDEKFSSLVKGLKHTVESYKSLADDLVNRQGDRYRVQKELADLRSKKLRFGSGSTELLTFYVQEVVRSLVRQSVKDCKSNGNKTISFDNFSVESLSKSDFWDVVKKLDCVRKLVELLERKSGYNKIREKAKQELSKFPSKKKEKTGNKKPKQKGFPSFEEFEVNKGWATKPSNEGYSWNGIDFYEGPNYTTYVRKMIKTENSRVAGTVTNIKKNVSGFLSNLINQLVLDFSNKVKCWKKLDGGKRNTLSVSVVLMIIDLVNGNEEFSKKCDEFLKSLPKKEENDQSN
jgi:hypothetical protein